MSCFTAPTWTPTAGLVSAWDETLRDASGHHRGWTLDARDRLHAGGGETLGALCGRLPTSNHPHPEDTTGCPSNPQHKNGDRTRGRNSGVPLHVRWADAETSVVLPSQLHRFCGRGRQMSFATSELLCLSLGAL